MYSENIVVCIPAVLGPQAVNGEYLGENLWWYTDEEATKPPCTPHRSHTTVRACVSRISELPGR